MKFIKSVLVFVFLIFVGFAFYFLLGYSITERNEKFMDGIENKVKIDNNYFISSIAATNYNVPIESVSSIEPFFNETYTSSEGSVCIQLYSFTFFDKNTFIDGFFIFVKDFTLSETQITQPITIEYLFDQDLVQSDLNQKTLIRQYTKIFDSEYFAFFREDELKNSPSNPYANILSIKILYNEQTVITLAYDSSLLNSSDVISNEKSKIINLEHSLYDLTTIYNLNENNDNFKTTSELYYNESIINELRSYNYIVAIYLIVFFLIVIILGYFLFFNHYFYTKYKINKQKKLDSLSNLKNT
ncbi:MAG: hypothetical protein LBV58_01095 [Acholeplasmatales bacterium]|jgi:hypothetical protein|nr:hypothetical protein [Acholeplasmatales bacterium]